MLLKIIIPAALLLVGGCAYILVNVEAAAPEQSAPTTIRDATPQEKAQAKRAMTGWGSTFGGHR